MGLLLLGFLPILILSAVGGAVIYPIIKSNPNNLRTTPTDIRKGAIGGIVFTACYTFLLMAVYSIIGM